MAQHLKRQNVPNKWPISRKGTTFVVNANFNPSMGMPILILLRDLLKVAQNRKEVKSAIHDKNILLNNKLVIDDKHTAILFDVITLIPTKANYRVELTEKGKFTLNEIEHSKADKKVAKIINKKTLNGKKTQLNLLDGTNFLSDIECKINDSVLIDFKNRKISKVLPLKEGANILVFEGKHAGKTGKINKFVPELKMAEIITNNGKMNVLIKQLIVIE